MNLRSRPRELSSKALHNRRLSKWYPRYYKTLGFLQEEALNIGLMVTGAVLGVLLVVGVEIVDGVRHDVARVHRFLKTGSPS